MRRTFDIDIDVKGGLERGEYGVRCAIYNDETERLQPHPSGVIIEDVPADPISGLACIDYKECDRLGLYKVDLLTNNSYNIFVDQEEMEHYRDMEPDFTLLQIENICKQLPHIGNHYQLVKDVNPQSVEDLADVLALMRPAKLHLVEDYMEPHKRQAVKTNLYRANKNGVYFKKSHAISYAVMIITVMNKLKDNTIY